MKQTTKKHLKHLVNSGAAQLIEDENNSPLVHGRYDRIAYSHGINGATGLLVTQDGKLYAIIGRNNALFYYL